MTENARKEAAMHYLGMAIASTRAGSGLRVLCWDPEKEVVRAEFAGGMTQTINVAGDSEWAMIMDVIGHIILG